MKRLFLVLALTLLILGISSASAKEDTHIDLEIDSFGYCVIVTLKDSNDGNIANQPFDLNITKQSGHVRKFTNERLNRTGQDEFYLGNGEFKVDVIYKGNDKYNPSNISKNFSIHKSDGKSIYYYYDDHNYGDNLLMDEYIYDNYWDEEIYDDAETYDGEGY